MEAGIYDKTRIYATDINDKVIERARAGRFPLERMRDYTANYLRAGGQEEFSRYYTVEGDQASFTPDLCSRVVFANHNLVSDGPFNDFNVIVCRNVMIYFGKGLQERVHDLFYESLETFGVLALGHKESIRFTPHEKCFEELNPKERLYRKIR
jgi:chemotaxis protein methyltransferase CheR